MFGPAFTALWLLSLIVVATLVLRFVLRTTLVVWWLIDEALETRMLSSRVAKNRRAARGPETTIRITPPRRRVALADVRAAA